MNQNQRNILKRIINATLAFLALAFLVLLIAYIAIRPKKPIFDLFRIEMVTFNALSPTFIAMKQPMEVLATNPNSYVKIFFDDLEVYAVYRTQQITQSAFLHKVDLGHKSYKKWWPYLDVNTKPLVDHSKHYLADDVKALMVPINVRVKGKMRWVLGKFKTGRYSMTADCQVGLTFRHSKGGYVFNGPVFYDTCSIDV